MSRSDWMPDLGCQISLGMATNHGQGITRETADTFEDLVNANRALPEITHTSPAWYVDAHGKKHKMILTYPATSNSFKEE